MNKQGFTLVEVLTTVLIIGILTSIAMPMYTRAVERARATEAMNAIKALNDSIYAYYSEKEECPVRFSQLVVNLPASGLTSNVVQTKNFQFELDNAEANTVPGTECWGALATRINGGSYSYKIWNPFTRGTEGKGLSLQCDAEDDKSIAICESLGLYRSSTATE